jgi:hypothetical protein
MAALPRPVEVNLYDQTWQPAELTHEYKDGSARVTLDGYWQRLVKAAAWREVGS